MASPFKNDYYPIEVFEVLPCRYRQLEFYKDFTLASGWLGLNATPTPAGAPRRWREGRPWQNPRVPEEPP